MPIPMFPRYSEITELLTVNGSINFAMVPGWPSPLMGKKKFAA